MENPNHLYPLIVTDKLAETRDYYKNVLGFSLSVDMEHYLQVQTSMEKNGPELCFMTKDAMPDAPSFPVFEGKGLIISIPTKSADKTAAAIVDRGQTLLTQPADRPWGWRSFTVADPNGVVLDLFHVIAESPMLSQNATS